MIVDTAMVSETVWKIFGGVCDVLLTLVVLGVLYALVMLMLNPRNKDD